jgi:hypothetical protein
MDSTGGDSLISCPLPTCRNLGLDQDKAISSLSGLPRAIRERDIEYLPVNYHKMPE